VCVRCLGELESNGVAVFFASDGDELQELEDEAA
jgi:hypothetical protein